jgi:hypothetical protein
MRLPVTDLFFRSLFAFIIIYMHSRKVIHVGVTRSLTDAWTAQQLREAIPYGQSPKCLSSDGCAKERMVPLGGACFTCEVA